MQPKAKKIPHWITTHQHKRQDPYYWMRDRENPEVIQYIEEENVYLQQQMAGTTPLQSQLFSEMKGRIKEDDESVPYFKKGYYWYKVFRKGKEYPIYCRKKGDLTADEEVILDVNELASEASYCHVSGIAVNHEEQLLAYGLDTIGRRIYSIYFKDLRSGNTHSLAIPSSTGNFTWAGKGTRLLYARQDPQTLRSHQIFLHQLGTSAESDTLLYEEKDEEFACYIHKTKSEHYLFIHSESTSSSEIRFIEADHPDKTWRVIQKRQDHLEYAADHIGDYFWIRTNHKATNFKIVRALISQPQLTNWEEVIPHRADTLLEDFDLFSNYFVVQERRKGLTRLVIHPWEDAAPHALDFGEDTYMAWIGTNPELDSSTFQYGFNSLRTPASIFEYDPIQRTKKLLKQQELVGGYEPNDYHSERIWAEASDHTRVPISLVYKRSLYHKDGRNPLLLYAYGSYGINSDAYFSSNRLSLLDRGFVFAIAHVRGGEDLGREWYEAGKLLQKRNTFTDFISCAEHLCKTKYTQRDRLYALGGSAGGLLIGAVVNMRPELFDGVIAAVPFVDVVTTMLDDSIPLTTGEYQEWGNPNLPDYYHYMLSYSPYDQVEAKAYPHMLVTSGLHDSQVQFWEPTKWVAKLRDIKTDANLLLLHTHMEAGHGGASGRFESLKEVALQYAFLLHLASQKGTIPEDIHPDRDIE